MQTGLLMPFVSFCYRGENHEVGRVLSVEDGNLAKKQHWKQTKKTVDYRISYIDSTSAHRVTSTANRKK